MLARSDPLGFLCPEVFPHTEPLARITVGLELSMRGEKIRAIRWGWHVVEVASVDRGGIGTEGKSLGVVFASYRAMGKECPHQESNLGCRGHNATY